jgi:hypothetical protein
MLKDEDTFEEGISERITMNLTEFFLRNNSYSGPVRLSYKSVLFQPRTIFFFHNRSTNNIFSHGFSAKRTRPHQLNIIQFKLCVSLLIPCDS